jgi:hypothetical protein
MQIWSQSSAVLSRSDVDKRQAEDGFGKLLSVSKNNHMQSQVAILLGRYGQVISLLWPA